MVGLYIERRLGMWTFQLSHEMTLSLQVNIDTYQGSTIIN